MPQYKLSIAEQRRRREISEHVRNMILSRLDIEEQDESSVMTGYRDYYLQISFSELHPLMVFCLAKKLNHTGGTKQLGIINNLNLKSILGSHSVNKEVGCYSYRATHWLDNELEVSRFFEILDRCVDEADKGYACLAG